jgi:hypothetical protein
MDTQMEVSMKSESSPRQTTQPALNRSSPDLEKEIERILSLDVPALRERWTSLFGTSPSPLLSRVFMSRAITYRMQEQAFGGLKPSIQRILDRACEPEGNDRRLEQRRRAGAGTLLIREWHGVKHRVTVLDSDVLYRNRRYKSLSEVARLITGTHWSGPLFFGLKNWGKEKDRG